MIQIRQIIQLKTPTLLTRITKCWPGSPSSASATKGWTNLTKAPSLPSSRSCLSQKRRTVPIASGSPATKRVGSPAWYSSEACWEGQWQASFWPTRPPAKSCRWVRWCPSVARLRSTCSATTSWESARPSDSWCSCWSECCWAWCKCSRRCSRRSGSTPNWTTGAKRYSSPCST